tara:strand:- start:228 stop:896 length:669 start_codon:yes stop_codon:yes gene_type:complete
MNEIENALNSILKKSDYNLWTQKPFTIKNHVYSTNLHTIIKLPKESVGSFDDCKKEINVKTILELFSFDRKTIFTVNIKDLKNDISKIPLIDEFINSDSEGKCLECDGDGQVEWEYGFHSKDMDCPVCDGEGVIIDSKRQKTGNKVKADGYVIEFNTAKIRSCMIEELINIADLLKVDKIELINEKNKFRGIAFKVGIAEVYMMPIMNVDKEYILNTFESKN